MIQSPRHRKHKECQGSQHLKRYDARDQGHPKMDFGIGEIEPGKLAWNNYIMFFHCSTGIQTLRMAMAGGSAGRAKDNDNQRGGAQRLSQIDSKVITLCDSYLKEPHKDISHIMRAAILLWFCTFKSYRARRQSLEKKTPPGNKSLFESYDPIPPLKINMSLKKGPCQKEISSSN